MAMLSPQPSLVAGLSPRSAMSVQAVQPRSRVGMVPRASGAAGAAADVAVDDLVAQQMEETARRRAALRAEMAAMRQKQQQAEAAPWWEVDCPANMINVDSVEQLRSTIEVACAADKLVVVNFFSPECYACRSMQPKLRQIAREVQERVVFLKVNGYEDGLREYVDGEGITKIPYFHLYRHQSRVSEFTANMSPPALKLLRRELDVHSRAGADAGAAADADAAAAHA